MAQDHNPVPTGRVFLGPEGAAQRGPGAEDPEELVADPGAQHALGGVAFREVEGPVVDGGERSERALPLLDVEEVAGRRPVRRSPPGRRHHVDAARLGERQRAQHHGLDHAEDGRGCPDAKGQRGHRERREGRAPPHLPKRELQVLPELSPPFAPMLLAVAATSDLSTRAAGRGKVAEATLGCGPRRARVHALGLEFAGPHLEVEVELVFHFAIDRGTQQRGQASPAHARPQAGRRTRDTAATNSVHAFVSRPSSLRPSRVSL